MAKPTKIEHVETLLWNRWLLIRIHCEDGTVGIGEGGVHGWQRPTKTMVEVMTPYLLGKNPHHIEHHYQFLYRSSHFMGAVVQGALSAIDIALWDIKGKRLGVPIYDLMGGKTRQKVRCYIHVRGDTLDKLVQDAVAKARQGFTAVRFSPWSPDFYLHKSYAEWAAEAVQRVGAVREAVGSGRGHLRRNPPADESGRSDCPGAPTGAVQPVLLRGPHAPRLASTHGRRAGAL